MHEFDDTALELRLRAVLKEHLGPLPLELTVAELERRRARRDWLRRRRHITLGIGLAAALMLPAGWLAVGAPMPRLPAPMAIVIAPTPPPSMPSNVTRPNVEELGRPASGQLSAFGSTRLADGRVLLVGGADTTIGQQTVATAWLFDPTSKRFVPTGAMTASRASPLAVALLDGQALVIGGWHEEPGTDAESSLSTAELYDPATGTFAATAALPDQRRDCPCGARNRLPWALKHATLLNDGRVFVAGGDVTGSGSGATLADVFDPNTERWSQLDIGCDAARGTQALLHDGRVLIVCVDGTGDVRARLFDPASRTFSEAAKPSAADSKATTLADGRILLTGRDPIIYEPASDLFLALPPGPRPDQGQTGIDVGSGRVLFLGDEAAGQATLTFDDRSGTFAFGPAGFASADAVVPLGDGRILTVGDRLEARLLDPGHVP